MEKKILIVTPFFIPAYSYGWIVRVAYEQAKWLVERWYDVTVVTTDVFDSKNRVKILNETIGWIKIIRFKNISNYLAKFQNLYLPIWMEKWIKNNISNYNIIHIHDIYNFCTYWAWKYALKKNKKYFIQPHWTLSNVRIESRKKWIKYFILKMMKNIFDKANWFFALTKIEIEEIKSFTDNKNILELSNWINLEKFKNIQPFDIHKEYNLDKKIKIITFLWRIQYIKWLDIWLKILSELDKEYKNWRLLIIWPDEWEKQRLVDLSKYLWIYDKIIWYWEENTNKKYSLLAWSDLFLLPSRSEWFPVTLLEALACNLPVFISKWCNFEINTNIWSVFDWKDIIKSKDIIIDLLERKSFNKEDLKLYIDKYDMNNIILKLISYYENK